ncbi:MAG: PIN domain-containing protein [Acidobacteriia bacterium]|nr:PIN domain-containing protein [Terriglobia bacterium]
MELILDTNALSAFADGDPRAAARFAEAASVYLPAIVLGEYRFGIAQSRHRSQHERIRFPQTTCGSRHFAANTVILSSAGTGTSIASRA